MRPKQEPEQPQRELFQVDLEQLIDMSHPLVLLDCASTGVRSKPLWEPLTIPVKAPGISTRLWVQIPLGTPNRISSLDRFIYPDNFLVTLWSR